MCVCNDDSICLQEPYWDSAATASLSQKTLQLLGAAFPAIELLASRAFLASLTWNHDSFVPPLPAKTSLITSHP